jgi:hypothetical protein
MCGFFIFVSIAIVIIESGINVESVKNIVVVSVDNSNVLDLFLRQFFLII